MRKLKVFILVVTSFVCLSSSSFCGNQWNQGTGEDSILGSETISDIDTASFENIVDPLDRLLSNYREGCKIEYLSASTLTVELGEVVVSNSAGSIRLMQQNTSDTTVTWSNLDTGSENDSTTYYIFAYQDTVATTTFSIKISASSTVPSGVTYYKKLGSFYNNSSSNIEQIKNDDTYMLIGTGTVAHAGTIPLPTGYLQSQCKWIVSINTLQHHDRSWDGTVYHYCSATADRVVTVRGYNSNYGGYVNGTANYIIVGHK